MSKSKIFEEKLLKVANSLADEKKIELIEYAELFYNYKLLKRIE